MDSNSELTNEISEKYLSYCGIDRSCKSCKYDFSTCSISFTLDYLAEHGYLKEHPDKMNPNL